MLGTNTFGVPCATTSNMSRILPPPGWSNVFVAAQEAAEMTGHSVVLMVFPNPNEVSSYMSPKFEPDFQVGGAGFQLLQKCLKSQPDSLPQSTLAQTAFNMTQAFMASQSSMTENKSNVPPLPDITSQQPSSSSSSAFPSVASLLSCLHTDQNQKDNFPTLQMASPPGSCMINNLLNNSTYDTGTEPTGFTPSPTGRRRNRTIELIQNKSTRTITFAKRKAGIMKKAYELSTLTGCEVLLLVASESGHLYTFGTPKLQPVITATESKNFIQACLNADNSKKEEIH